MKNKTYIFQIVVALSLLFTFCAKRPFAKMSVKGQIISAKTKQPIESAYVSLWVGCNPTICGHGNKYGETKTDSNGNFEIKSNAQWNGNEYYLVFLIGKTREFTASKNQDVNIGIIEL